MITNRYILEALLDIEIGLGADDITCWESPECPYCMIRRLRVEVQEDIGV